MKFNSIIKKLYKERDYLDQLIVNLRQIQATAVVKPERVKKRRGRKSMDPAERRQVAERMRNYWALRRIKSAEPETARSASAT